MTIDVIMKLVFSFVMPNSLYQSPKQIIEHGYNNTNTHKYAASIV